jgi:eukaryotic-like serine/threonine-protein kinase
VQERHLGRYELLARLASGGMGEIFLARLEGAAGFEKLFAVKRILPQYAAEPRFRRMLIAEAQIAARMSHAHICQVYELGESAGQLYIVMEYLDGATLLALLRACAKLRTRLELGFIAAVAAQVTDALHYAHELRDKGESLHVVHRDISPANIFVCESGPAKILDFGIAKVKDASSTQTDTVKGKYAYMAPEQLRGEEIDRRADVFALGIVLYEMLALRRLFQRQTDYLTFDAVLERPIPELQRFRPDVPDGVAAVVHTALARDPARRFATARQLGTALADAIGKPWSSPEVGELVRAKLAADRERQRAAIARALSEPGHLDGEPLTGAGDDQDFPVIETVPDEPNVSAEVRTVVDRRIKRVQIAASPLPPSPAPSQVHVPTPPRRRARAIALGATVLAGGGVTAALVLAPATPTEIVVDKTDAPTRETDMSAVGPHMRALASCAARHPAAVAKATANLVISSDGSARTIRFSPSELDGDPLGTCLAGVLRGIRFAPRNAESLFALDLNLPASRR